MICTVTLETAKKLKEAGFRQDSFLSWSNQSYSEQQAYIVTPEPERGFNAYKECSAPTTDELLDELPLGIDIAKVHSGKAPCYDCFYFKANNESPQVFSNENLSEALASMWLWLKAEGLLK